MLDGLSNYWYFTGNVLPVKVVQQNSGPCTYPILGYFAMTHLRTIKDTSINNQSYSNLEQFDFMNPFDTCVVGYIREDTVAQQIYFMDNTFGPENLIYDFSMAPGDSIQLDFIVNGYFPSDQYLLDSITTESFPIGQRRVFFLTPKNQFSNGPLIWIEGVGNPGYLIYTHSENFDGGLFSWVCQDYNPRNFSSLLTCFEHGNQKVYIDSCAHSVASMGGCLNYADSCNYWNICGAVDESDLFNSFNINPNPSKDQIHLELESDFDSGSELILYSLNGKVLLKEPDVRITTGINRISLDVTTLSSGSYILRVLTPKGSYSSVVVIGK